MWLSCVEGTQDRGQPSEWTRVGGPAQETHPLGVQPGPGAMVMSQDGYLGGDYSIGEAAGPYEASVAHGGG